MANRFSRRDIAISEAQSDMVVCLEDARRRLPDIDFQTLTMVKEIKDYATQICQDMQNEFGGMWKVSATEGLDNLGQPYHVVKVQCFMEVTE